ncbi:hypothetical protein [Streptomyces sp. NPDC001635]
MGALSGVVAALGSLALAGFPAQADPQPPQQGDPEVIHACYNERSGALRYVSDDEECRRHERPLSWSRLQQPGPQGPAGPAGPAGPQGPRGPQGPGGPGVLAGVVRFVDASETDGFVGAAGQANLEPTADAAGTPLPDDHHVGRLRVRVGERAPNVTVTIVRNGTATALSCTTDATGTCAAPAGSPIAFAAGDTIAAEVQHPAGTPLRDVRWTTDLEP